jgi:hypothetical protein
MPLFIQGDDGYEQPSRRFPVNNVIEFAAEPHARATAVNCICICTAPPAGERFADPQIPAFLNPRKC